MRKASNLLTLLDKKLQTCYCIPVYSAHTALQQKTDISASDIWEWGPVIDSNSKHGYQDWYCSYQWAKYHVIVKFTRPKKAIDDNLI